MPLLDQDETFLLGLPADQQQQQKKRYPGQIDLKEAKKRQTGQSRHNQNGHEAFLAGGHQQRAARGRPVASGPAAATSSMATAAAGSTVAVVRRGRLGVRRQLRVVVEVGLPVGTVLDVHRRIGDVLDDEVRRGMRHHLRCPCGQKRIHTCICKGQDIKSGSNRVTN